MNNPQKCYVHPTAVVYPNVVLGSNVYIGPFCVIGAPPEHRDELAKGNPGKGVYIGDNTRLEKLVVVDSGIDDTTNIGIMCEIMSGTHIGHDAQIWDGATLAPKAMIGGYAIIGESANIGMGAVIHQKARVQPFCMIGAGAVVVLKNNAEMQPMETWAGVPARKIGMNKKWVK